MAVLEVLTRDEDRTVQAAAVKAVRMGCGMVTAAGSMTARGGIGMICRPALAVLLGLEAGLRAGEIAGIRWSQADLRDVGSAFLRVQSTISKSVDTRRVPCSGALFDALDRYARVLVHWGVFSAGYPIVARPGSADAVTTRTVYRWIQASVDGCIGRKIHPHMLRHTFGTRLIRVTDVRVVQELLGHRRLSSTQIYLHTTDDDCRKAVDDRAGAARV